MIIEPIAHIFTGFSDKFGIPRQSGISNAIGKIVFEQKFRDDEAVRGLSDFSHIWLIWEFFEFSAKRKWSPTVRPPRLGGNTRVGVFATRSPNRPNPLGLSCVKIEKIQKEENSGIVLYVSGVDMLNNTPIYDIKPYIPFADCIPNANGGYTEETEKYSLNVSFPEDLAKKIPEDKLSVIIRMLENDPRPSYHEDENRIYGMIYSQYEVRFSVKNGLLSVKDVCSISENPI